MRTKPEEMLVMKPFAIVCVVALCGSAAVADYADPWLPDWPGETGYTSQFWGLHAVGGEEPAQPLAADNYIVNDFGVPTAVWDSDEIMGRWGWTADPPGDHPYWVDEVWGGMAAMGGGIDLTMTVPTGTDEGFLRVFVQYDWFSNGSLSASIAGATDVTPPSYWDFQIGVGGADNDPWYRTTKVFELADNASFSSIDVVLHGADLAPLVDSFSVTTAVDAVVPTDMPVPEPAALVLLVVGGLLTLGHRRRAVQPDN